MRNADRANIAEPRPLAGALVGLTAGLIASYAMNRVQVLLPSPPDDGSKPSTEIAADKVHLAARGEPVPRAHKEVAGDVVHYALGAALGAGYGMAAEYLSGIKRGAGMPFGVAVAILLDEVAVPALGLSKPPWKFGVGTHGFSLASHVVFGVSNEIARRVLRRGIA